MANMKRFIAILLTLCVTFVFTPIANMEEIPAEPEYFEAPVEEAAEADILAESVEEDFGEVEFSLGDEEEALEEEAPVEAVEEAHAALEAFTYAKALSDIALYADAQSADAVATIAKDAVLLVTDVDTGARYTVAFNTGDGIMTGYVDAAKLAALNDDDTDAFYDALAEYEYVACYKDDVDLPLANIEPIYPVDEPDEDAPVVEEAPAEEEPEEAPVEEEAAEEEAAEEAPAEEEAAEEAFEEPMELIEAASAITITEQPKTIVAAEGTTLKFTVKATGDNLTYQWQYSQNGTSWSNGASTATSYSWKLTAARNNRYVRVIITDASGNTVTSDAAQGIIGTPINITKQPATITAPENTTLKFTVEAEGDGLTYQWQYSQNGTSWSNGASTTDSYSWKLTAARNNRYVRVIITDTNGVQVISDAAQGIIGEVVPAITIVKQPEDIMAPENTTLKFTVEAEGEGLTYQWQYSQNGTSWANGASTTDSYSWKLTAARNNRYVRVIIKDANGGQVISDVAQGTIGTPIVIVTQPADVLAAEGTYITFTVEAEGEGLTYQWQYSQDGETWNNGASTTDSYRWKLTAARNNRYVRVIITDANGAQIISDAAQGTIGSPIVIVTQPQDIMAPAGTYLTFTVEAEGDDLTYQWQYSQDGTTWKNGASTTDSYRWQLTEARNNRQVRVIVKDSHGGEVISEPATGTIGTPIVIVKQPEDIMAAKDTTITFTVEAEGEGLTYQWQYSQNGTSWYNGASTTDSYSWKLTEARNNRQVRVIITDANGATVTSEAATGTIGNPLVIVTQPADISAPVNTTITFTVEAEGDDLTYQWQYSQDGETWNNGASTTDSYSWKLTEARNNRQVRVIVKDSHGTEVTSDAATGSIMTDITLNEVVYEIIDSASARVKAYLGTASSLTIPEVVEGMTVKEIGESAFEGNTALVSIDLPDTIEIIGKRAFANCTNLSSMS